MQKKTLSRRAKSGTGLLISYMFFFMSYVLKMMLFAVTLELVQSCVCVNVVMQPQAL